MGRMHDFTNEVALSNIICAKHLLYYVPRNVGGDSWTDPILEFKANERATVRMFCSAIAEGVRGDCPPFDVVIRMLGSSELKSYGPWPPVQRLAIAVAEAIGSSFEEHFLRKRYATPKFAYGLGRFERYRVLREALYIKGDINLESQHRILLVDDVTTSASTVRVVHELLQERAPGIKLGFICLARTSYEKNANDGFVLSGG